MQKVNMSKCISLFAHPKTRQDNGHGTLSGKGGGAKLERAAGFKERREAQGSACRQMAKQAAVALCFSGDYDGSAVEACSGHATLSVSQ